MPSDASQGKALFTTAVAGTVAKMSCNSLQLPIAFLRPVYNFAPRGEMCPPGVKLSPRDEDPLIDILFL
jgi:hypothetical protein